MRIKPSPTYVYSTFPWSELKTYYQVDWQMVEFCYQPIIVSRSTKRGYDIRFTIESSEDDISHKGVLLVSLGIKYKSYCSNISRTLIVDPTPVSFLSHCINSLGLIFLQQQESQYQMLFDLQKELISFIKAGNTCRSVYQHAVAYIREKVPEMESHFVKSVGFGVCICLVSSYHANFSYRQALNSEILLMLSLQKIIVFSKKTWCSL